MVNVHITVISLWKHFIYCKINILEHKKYKLIRTATAMARPSASPPFLDNLKPHRGLQPRCSFPLLQPKLGLRPRSNFPVSFCCPVYFSVRVWHTRIVSDRTIFISVSGYSRFSLYPGFIIFKLSM